MARGFNVASDVIKTTVDGYDLNKIWTDLTQVLQSFNASKTPLLNLLTVDTTASADAFPLDGGKMSFERASEFGTPKSGKADPKYFIAGYDLDWYDLALRFTSSFLRDATAEQIKSQHMAAQAASDDLNFSLAMAELLTPTVLGARATNPEDQTRYSLYSGQTDDTPPVYKGRTFTAAHTHYLTTQSADLDGDDLEVGLRLVEVAHRREVRLLVDDAIAHARSTHEALPEARDHDLLGDRDVLVHDDRAGRGAHDPRELVADRDGHLPPAFAPRADAALAPHAGVLEQPVLGRRRHRRERVVDQVDAVAEDREAVAIGEQLVHAAEPTPRGFYDPPLLR